MLPRQGPGMLYTRSPGAARANGIRAQLVIIQMSQMTHQRQMSAPRKENSASHLKINYDEGGCSDDILACGLERSLVFLDTWEKIETALAMNDAASPASEGSIRVVLF